MRRSSHDRRLGSQPALVAGQPLQVRIGIATGLVVVGELIGSGDSRQQTAIDQLERYAQILGSKLRVVASPEDLREAIRSLSDEEFILIDTAGRSPRRYVDDRNRDLQWQRCGVPVIRLAIEDLQDGDALDTRLREEIMRHLRRALMARYQILATLCARGITPSSERFAAWKSLSSVL